MRVIVFDLDGVLADARHREHHVRGPQRDWGAFFAQIPADPPLEAGRLRLVEALQESTVVLLSGRPESTRQVTLTWLHDHGFPALPVHLRPDGDRRPARIFKREALAALGGPTVVALVIDDDPVVVGMLSAAGYRAELFSG